MEWSCNYDTSIMAIDNAYDGYC